MNIENNVENEQPNFHQNGEHEPVIEQKLNELVWLLKESSINAETAIIYKQRFNEAIKKAAPPERTATDEFSILLSKNPYDNRLIRQYLKSERVSKFILVSVSVIMIVMGLGMIIMPAPPFFEMFTIFYFNQTDGITIMDLISLIVVLAGVYFLIKAVYSTPVLKRLKRDYLKHNL